MPDQLKDVVQKMIDAGESEENIATVIQHFKTQETPPPPRTLGRGTGFSTANQKTNLNALAENAPMIGGGIGGAVAGPGGAAVGGAGGSLIKNLNRANQGAANTPTTATDAALDVAKSAGGQYALGKAGEGVGWAAGKVGEVVANRGVPLVRSALKQGMAGLRARAGIEGVTPNIVANRVAKFIVDNKLATAESARALVKKMGGQIDEATKAAEANPNVSPVLDTAERIPKYLNNVLKNIEKQYLPKGGREAVTNVGKELVEDSPLSQYVKSTGRVETPPVVTKSVTGAATPGGGFTFTAPQASESSVLATSRPRALRANVRPTEALETIREKSFFDPAAGEASRLGKKTIERATRDSFKEAVPDAAKPLLTQGRAMDAERALDAAAFRDANRDTVGFGATVGAMNAKPGLGMLSQLLKESQLRLGIAAPGMGRAVAGAGKNSAQAYRAASLLQQMLDDATQPK